MKIMYLPVITTDDDGATVEEMRRYEVRELSGEWVSLSCDGNHIAKLVDFEEARRVIWSYWINLGMDIPYLTAEDFDEVADDA